MRVPYNNRELSWLEFNQRVLNEAARGDLPLAERIKFFAITAANLDEFFQVRVGSLKSQLEQGVTAKDNSGLTPKRALAAIRERVIKMGQAQYALWNEELLPCLAREGVRHMSMSELTMTYATFCENYFDANIFPLLTPLAFDDDANNPQIPQLQIIVACLLQDAATQEERVALIPIPEQVARLVFLVRKEGETAFAFSEQVISANAHKLFPHERILATSCFRLTRNADLAIGENTANDFADEMDEMVKARRFASTVRIELEKNAPATLTRHILKYTGAEGREAYYAEGPLATSNFFEFYGLPELSHLHIPEWKPQQSPSFPPRTSMFAAIAANDVLLFHPYESYQPMIDLLNEAAADPNVLAIKIALYRTAKKSRIVQALINAANNGKTVIAVVELRARFDEERNMDRAGDMLQAGVQIVYGVKNLKTHAKICMIVRREHGSLRRYLHFATGNYNESTAEMYGDLSYFTAKHEYGNDAAVFFNALTGRSLLQKFERLKASPNTLKKTLLEAVADEAERAKQGEEARIMIKVNSLEDPDVIAAMYQASQAGVTIKLNVRGICCLQPGLPGYSTNIEVVSVVDRYLEHARIYYFHHGGDANVFISSADLMRRNLERRVELLTPIEEQAMKRRLLKILEAYFMDNCQASRILADGSFERLTPSKNKRKFRAQAYFYEQATSLAQAASQELTATFEPHLPT